jgi:hypothetical protein
LTHSTAPIRAVTVILTEDGSADLAGQVRVGALIGAAGGVPEGLGALPIASERLVAARRASLAERPRLALADLERALS